MIAIVHSIYYSQSVHALALNAGSMDNHARVTRTAFYYKFFNQNYRFCNVPVRDIAQSI